MQQSYPDVTPRPERFVYSIVALPDKGRGLVATEPLERGDLIEIAPVVVLPKADADLACQTLLNDYVFTWKRPPGSMAVSLGVGSLFNHDKNPNVSYTLDYESSAIVYRASRTVQAGQELCIYYGPHAAYDQDEAQSSASEEESVQDGDLSTQQLQDGEPQASHWRYVLSEPEQMTPELELVTAWTLKVQPKQLKLLFEQLRRLQGRDDPLHHLRRVPATVGDSPSTSLLLFPTDRGPEPREWLRSIGFEGIVDISTVDVPAHPAPTSETYDEWSKVWPLTKRPDQRAIARADAPILSMQAQAWLDRQITRVLQQADVARRSGNVPTACVISDTWDETRHGALAQPRVYAVAHDTSQETGNSLAHCVVNAIDVVAQADLAAARDGGAAYLLTGLTVVMTHEPCLFCSMSLLHSRIAHLFYLVSSPHSGGCGSVHAVHEETNLNHRFHVWQYQGHLDGRVAILQQDV